jgi:hypothetical protein
LHRILNTHKNIVMKKVTLLALFICSFLSSYAQDVQKVNLQLVSKKTRVQIWREVQADTTYYLSFMNDKYQVLKDQSITKMDKAQLKELAETINKMAANEPGEYQVKISCGIFLFMDKGEKSYWLTIYDVDSRFIKMKTNLVNILLKDISLQ